MLRYWEGERPCPPPGFAPETISGRIEWCAQERASAQQKDSVRAKLAQIHLSDADGPEECLKLIDQTFLNVGHYWTFRVPSYVNACLDEQALHIVAPHPHWKHESTSSFLAHLMAALRQYSAQTSSFDMGLAGLPCWHLLDTADESAVILEELIVYNGVC